MIPNEKIIQSICAAIDEVNDQLPAGEQIEKTSDTALFGVDGKLDSLGLVSLVTSIEQSIEDNTGMSVTILEEIELLEDENPFKSIDALAEYITSILVKEANG